jgi:CspA family cold shock protein
MAYLDEVAVFGGNAPRGRLDFPQTVRLLLGSGRWKGSSMTTGTVKSVRSENGYGYIAGDDGTEYYFHRAGVKRPLQFDNLFGGERVKFEIEANAEGPRAVQVTRA